SYLVFSAFGGTHSAHDNLKRGHYMDSATKLYVENSHWYLEYLDNGSDCDFFRPRLKNYRVYNGHFEGSWINPEAERIRNAERKRLKSFLDALFTTITYLSTLDQQVGKIHPLVSFIEHEQNTPPTHAMENEIGEKQRQSLQ